VTISSNLLYYYVYVCALLTRYLTAKPARSTSLYYSRQCGIVIKPRLDCADYAVVRLVMQDCS